VTNVNYQNIPSAQAWGVDRTNMGGRDWSAPAIRFNNVTVGQPFTMPQSTAPELARALWIGHVDSTAATCTITLRPCNEVMATGVPTDYDITITVERSGSFPLPFACQQVVAVSGDISNIVWMS
jgi:hypothetical protein